MKILNRFSPAIWLILLAMAIWSQLLWMMRRMLDGSDDPLGVVALAALAFICWCQRRHLHAPRPAWFGVALLFVTLACVAWQSLPPLLAALPALLGLAAGMLSILPVGVACMPVLGLAALSLPLMASLQFYAGYPLRLLTAELSRWLLLAGHQQVERDGVALRVDGQLVLVDAACSGVQLVWLGYFTACVVALLTGCSNRCFLRRLPFVGCLVLVGNVFRNTALVALQADGTAVPAWLHEGIGLVTLATVCTLIFRLMQARPSRIAPDGHATLSSLRSVKPRSSPCLPFGRLLRARHDAGEHDGASTKNASMMASLRPQTIKLLATLLLPACALWNAFDVRSHTDAIPTESPVEWPVSWHGHPLRPLALSDIEQRFAQGFPGKIARLTDGQSMLVWRHVLRPTRMLHPATDCYRALGWRIHDERLEQIQNEQATGRWRCFTAERKRDRLRVCERIEDSAGSGFTDTSAWYWNAVTGQSTGPWQAMTVASPL